MEESLGDLARSDGVRGVSIHAGFPNPAVERRGTPLSLDRLLISHPVSTYFFRIRGHNWADRGVFDGDIAIIDRALEPHEQDLVVWWDEGGAFQLASFQRADQQNIWGVVSSTVRPLRKTRLHDE